MKDDPEKPNELSEKTVKDLMKEAVEKCPELAARLLQIEAEAEPFFGINEEPYDDDIRPF